MATTQPDPPPDAGLGLARLVKRMRDKQKEFFQFRHSRPLLAEAKKLEELVDEAVKAILNPPTTDLWDKM